MSDEPQPKVLTLDKLRAATQKYVHIKSLDADILVRRISSPEYMSTFPSAPPIAETWPEDREERAKCEEAWFDDLERSDPAEAAARLQKGLDRYARVLSMAALAPKMTFEEAKALGNDGIEAANEILLFSGVVRMKEQEKKTEPAAADSAGADPAGG